MIKDIEKNQRFVVVKAKIMPLLVLQTCREFNLIKRIHMIEGHSSKKMFIAENIDVFESSGTYKKTCKIEIDEKSTPVACPSRRIPYTVRDKLKSTLIKMVRDGNSSFRISKYVNTGIKCITCTNYVQQACQN